MGEIMSSKQLAIIGAGPSCVYVLERITAYATHTLHPFSLDLYIFDRSGQFGSGEVHSTQQPKSSFLNRIAGQVSFAADETIQDSGPLLPSGDRLALHEWCRQQYQQTKDEIFNIKAEDWPKRYIHGLALKYYFERYCSILKYSCPYINLKINHAEVLDIIEKENKFLLITDDPKLGTFEADHVLFATGHSSNDPSKCETVKTYVEFSKKHSATYVPSAYPLEYSIPSEKIGNKTVVACDGMGLTAIDIILYLSEGRGGIFEKSSSGKLKYKPSGLEPSRVIPFSGSGLFTFARPFNAKERNLEELEHKGIFLTDTAIDELRKSVGKPIEIKYFGIRYQLDFERHIWPLIILEMSFVYYKTLLGDFFAEYVKKSLLPVYKNYLSNGGDDLEIPQIIDNLIEPLEKCVDEVASLIDSVFLGQQSLSRISNVDYPWNLPETINRYIDVIYGNSFREEIKEALKRNDSINSIVKKYTSPFDHKLMLKENKFKWIDQIQPIKLEDYNSPESYQKALLRFMHKDHLWAAQNNLDNPAKAAADGVWRDLRPVLAHAADFGGLNAKSHKIFLDIYMRYHNRLCNGAALEVMEKMMALIEFGMLDVSVGPNAHLQMDMSTGKFRVQGPNTGANYEIDFLIDAKVHAFDPEKDIRPLYPNLYRRGLIQKWQNPSLDGNHFEPGGLALTPDFHPIRINGQIDRRLTFLGPPTEGIMFFQLGALRPNKNHHVMQDILLWFRDFWKEVIETNPEKTSSVSYVVARG
jgi:hypothetical protein